MVAYKTPNVIFQSSRANHPDSDIVKRLIAGYPNLQTLRQIKIMTGGYSGSRVYLALAEVPGTPPAHWILKVGPASDICAESEAFDASMATPANSHAVPKVFFNQDGDDGLLVYQFAGLEGEPPLDLEQGLKDYSSAEMIGSIASILAKWSSQPEWKNSNVTKQLQEWSLSKLQLLPSELQGLVDSKTLYVPDLGEALSNPGYYIHRKALPRVEVRVPYSFTHGDLNLRNILFPTDRHREPNPREPKFIDFRFAGTENWAIIDLAKIEACIRYHYISEPTTQAKLSAQIAFLDASTTNLEMSRPPEILGDEKILQELWRHLTELRKIVAKITTDEDSQKSFWATLVSYSITLASYMSNRPFNSRIAYIDGARIFTRYFCKPDLKVGQKTIPLQPGLSPHVQAIIEPSSWAAARLLSRSIESGDVILVTGPQLGRSAGVEPLPVFLQNIHKDLSRNPPPTTSLKVLLASLDRAFSRTTIIEAIRTRVSKWSIPEDVKQLKGVRWSGIIHLHYNNFIRSTLHQFEHPYLSIESQNDLSKAADMLTDSTTVYVPFFGDSDSHLQSYPISPAEIDARFTLVNQAMSIARRRLKPLCVVFWRCEDIELDFLLDLRLRVSDESESVEAFYVSDRDHSERDASLSAAGITPIKSRLEELIPVHVKDTEKAQQASAIESQWRRGDIIYRLPKAERRTSGLLSLFNDIGSISFYKNPHSGFLLGAPLAVADIEDGRVLKRNVIESELLPAIEEGIIRTRYSLRWVFVEGRAGAGVSTCLCLTAHQLSIREVAPVYVIARPDGQEEKTWLQAGELIGEVSKQVKRTVIAFLDSADIDVRLLDQLAEGLLNRQGELVLVVGGRTESIGNLKHELNLEAIASVKIPETLKDDEWRTLARIVKNEGYSAGFSENTLAIRMQHVGLLLPAIYEGTDRKNRKFQDIVACEYSRYANDQLVQRAYRLICTASYFGMPLNKYWLLKSVGGAAISDASRILGALSRDIVIEQTLDDDRLEGDLTVAPRHRLIAEAVLDTAVSDPEHRLSDMRRLLQVANLSAFLEGDAVAKTLVRQSLFRTWMKEVFGQDRAKREALDLFKCALLKDEIHPIVEITLRHHYALTLRSMCLYDEAVDQAQKAYDKNKSNPASAHVLGLVHEARALARWKMAIKSSEDNQLFTRAIVDEQEAMVFFRQSRDLQPTEEYGYQSEARYLSNKESLFSEPRNSDKIPENLKYDAKEGLARGLRLVHEAELRISPKLRLKSYETKVKLLSQMGDFDEAWKLLTTAIEKAEDSVAENKIRELAAAIAATHKRWTEAKNQATLLIENGMRSPYVYLVLDDALHGLDLRQERRRRASESANEWNCEDVETLLRWAGICVEEEDWELASSVLERARKVAQRLGLSMAEQLRQRGVARNPEGLILRVVGRIIEMIRPYEGLVQPSGVGEKYGIYFRCTNVSGTTFEVGDSLEFTVSWRIRGLRAENIKKL